MTKRLLNSDCLSDWHHTAAELREIEMRVDGLSKAMLKSTVGADMLPCEMAAILCVLNQLQECKSALDGIAKQSAPVLVQVGDSNGSVMGAPPIVRDYQITFENQ